MSRYHPVVNPMRICQQLYGKENVNEVRDCILDSIYRFYGQMCLFHQNNLSKMINQYLITILEDAGRNPDAVKLPVSPSHLEPAFFVKRYIETRFNPDKAYELCVSDCCELSRGASQVCEKRCIIDRHAI